MVTREAWIVAKEERTRSKMSGRRKVNSLSYFILMPLLYSSFPTALPSSPLLSRSNITPIVPSPHRCQLEICMRNIGGSSRKIAKLIPAAATEIQTIIWGYWTSSTSARNSSPLIGHRTQFTIHWFLQRWFNNNRKLIRGQLTGGGSGKVSICYSSISNIIPNLSSHTSNNECALTDLDNTIDIDCAAHCYASSSTVGAGGDEMPITINKRTSWRSTIGIIRSCS